jgi:hypothetical protein
MPGAAFKTYDAIKSQCKRQPDYTLIWWGAAHTLANLNDRSIEQERQGIKWLVNDGWLECLAEVDEEAYRYVQPRFKGGFTTYRFRVVEHDEWAKEDECPPLRYDPKTGKPIVKGGHVPDGLMRSHIQKWTGVEFPAELARGVWDAVQARKRERKSSDGE